MQTTTPFALVVEDDELTQELLREVLVELGFAQVQSALDGRKALRMLADPNHHPRILVCDIFMPEMDGLEFLDKLAALQFKGGVVMITGGDPEMLKIARDIAVSNGLQVLGAFLKPVSLDQMAVAVATISKGP